MLLPYAMGAYPVVGHLYVKNANMWWVLKLKLPQIMLSMILSSKNYLSEVHLYLFQHHVATSV